MHVREFTVLCRRCGSPLIPYHEGELGCPQEGYGAGLHAPAQVRVLWADRSKRGLPRGPSEQALATARPLLARMFEPVDNPTEAMRILCRRSHPEPEGYWIPERLFPFLRVCDLYLVGDGHVYATREARSPEEIQFYREPGRGAVIPSLLLVWTLAWGGAPELMRFRPVKPRDLARPPRAFPLIEDWSIPLSHSIRLWRVGYTVTAANGLDGDAIEAMVDATKELAEHVTIASAHPHRFG